MEPKLLARLDTMATNVYPLVAPLNYTRPAVVYNRVGTEVIRYLDDDTQTEAFVTFLIDVYSESFLEAKTLARRIKSNLIQWDDDDVQSSAWLDEHSTVDNTTEVQIYRVMLTFQFYSTDE